MWQLELNVLTLLLPDRNKYNTTENSGKINTAGNIISYTTVISIAYTTVAGFIRHSGIIIYFLRRKYPACKAAKGLKF